MVLLVRFAYTYAIGTFSLQEKYTRTMRDKADLSDKADQLEHLTMQLQGETDTIGEQPTRTNQDILSLKDIFIMCCFFHIYKNGFIGSKFIR